MNNTTAAHTQKTPLTDKNEAKVIGFYSCSTVPAVFARGLERKWNETAAQRDELLAALRPLLRWITIEIEGDEEQQPDVCDDLQRARAAIARAEGRAQ